MNTGRPAAAQTVESLDMPRRKGMTERSLDHIEAWVALALCGAVLVAALVQRLVPSRPAYAQVFAPDWIALPAAVLAGLAATATLRADHPPSLPRRVLDWSGCLLMVWASGGLLLDLLRVVGLIPLGVDWPGMVTRALALAASVVLAHLTLLRPPRESGGRAPGWFGWLACLLALPYPLLKTWWALGGTLGLTGAGVTSEFAGSFTLWLPSIPFLLAAILSLLLVPTWRRIPRWMLLTAGWVATAIAANVGPAACWALVTAKISGSPSPEGMATWVTPLFYGSWLLFAIAIGAATRSYQLRSAAPRQSETDLGQKGGERDGRRHRTRPAGHRTDGSASSDGPRVRLAEDVLRADLASARSRAGLHRDHADGGVRSGVVREHGSSVRDMLQIAEVRDGESIPLADGERR